MHIMYHYACLLVSLQDLVVVSALPLQDDDHVSTVKQWLGCSLLSLLGEEHQDEFKQLLVKLYDKKDYLSVRICDCKFGGRLTLVTGLLIDQNTALLRLSSVDGNGQQSSESNLQPLNNFEKHLQRFLDNYEKSKANGADQTAQGPLVLLSAASDALEHADDFLGAYDVQRSDYVTGRHSDSTMQDLGINENCDSMNAGDYAVYHHADTNVALLKLTDQILLVYSSPKRPIVNDSGYEGSNSNLDEFAIFITSPVNQFFDNAKDPLRALSRAAGTQTASAKSSHDKKMLKKRGNIRKKKVHQAVTTEGDNDEGNAKQDAQNLRVDTKFKLEEKISMMKSAKILRQLNQHCESCGIRDSPEWRKGPNGLKTLCNACGLKYARKIAKSSNRQMDSAFPQTPQESPVHTVQSNSGSGDHWQTSTQSAMASSDSSTPSKPAQQLIAPKLPLLMQGQQQPTLDPNNALAQQLYTNYQPLVPKYQLVPVFQYVSPMTSVQQQKYTPRMFPQGFMSPQMLRGQFITLLDTIQRPVAKLPISPVKRQAAKSNQ
ncbi:hypothetical protein MP228_005083 [Amoeboaphelidium protococcarum]|nr:hypothetical protein MP228_005083 [Amoeboaphelidium protococcarum]